MKKIFIKIMFLLIIIIPSSFTYALSTSDAKEGIDLSKSSSVTINYNYEDYDFNNIDVNIYLVAAVTEDYLYQVSDDYSMYQIKINGINTVQEWELLKTTLDAYIVADNKSSFKSEVIVDNKVTFSNLKPGLYFVKTKKIDTDDYSLLFDSFLISIPNLEASGIWNYDVSVYPKALEYIPKYEKIKYRVIKEWIDDNKDRPDSVEVEIYKDELLIDNKILSTDNNWTYEWEANDDGSKWSVVERNVPDNYNVLILEKDNSFMIINTDSNYEEENPKTYDDINLYIYLLFGSLIGIILVITSLLIKKKKV